MISGSKGQCPLNTSYEDEIKLFRGWIILQKDITILNYVCSLIHYFTQTFIFVTVESLQPMLFQNKFGILPRNQGTENGYILLIDILTKCLTAPIVGMLSDKFGRKIILQGGLILVGISMVGMGYSSSIYPTYCIARIIYAVGAITLATIPFLADYIHTDTKGRAAAINVVLAALGAVFSATVISNLLIRNMSISTAYLSSALGIVIFGYFYSTGLKAGTYFRENMDQSKLSTDNMGRVRPNNVNASMQQIYKRDDDYVNYEQEMRILQSVENKQDFQSAIKIACLAGRNVWIFQGYVTNFLGRGDSILLTLSLVIWSQQYIQDGTADPDDQYKKANIKAQTLSGVAYTVIMLFAVVYGILFERISKHLLLVVIFGLTLIGCILMNFAPGPDSPLTFVYMSILGLGMSGLYTAALYLINTYAYVSYRGYISGLANVFSVLGIMTCAFIGGILQDKWNNVAPFNLFGMMSAIGLILVIYSYFDVRRNHQLVPLQEEGF